MTTEETLIETATEPKAKRTKRTAAPTGKKKAAKAAKGKTPKKAAKAKATKTASEARPESKKAIVLALLQRKGGATMAEIEKATGWQKHSIRGFISGTATKKMGLAVTSAKNEAAERTYSID